MTYDTHNDGPINIDGTGLCGHINATCAEIEDHFGPPEEGDYKTDWEWAIRFDDGTIATIYNWKNGPNYCGHDGYRLHQITRWNVGGHTSEAVRLVKEQLNRPNVERTTNAMDQMSEAMNPVEERRIAAAESAQWTRDNDPDWRY